MKRRDFLAVLGGAATAWPLGARGQQRAIVGVLLSVSPEGYAERMRAFRHGLRESGYIEGQNVTLEYRWAEGQMDRLPALATELVRQKVAVIAALGGPFPAVAAKAATTTIPIVFGTPDDPVKLGLVKSLARPGGNLSGVHYFTGELVAKRLELLRGLVPKTRRIAMFANLANSTRMASIVRETEAAGRAMGLRIETIKTGSSGEIEAAFNALAAQRPDAIFVAPDPFFQGHRVQLVELAARHAIPVSYSVRDFCDVGGLMSYGADINDGFRQVGIYTGRVLKGEKPADLPVLQATKIEFVINLKTAKALGLEIHPQLLATADEVIE
jgi:putative tryptophan/tyrosine transport system substrate-binding protein